MSYRDAGIRGRGYSRRNAGDFDKRTMMLAEIFPLFTAPAKHVRIPPLQANHHPFLLRGSRFPFRISFLCLFNQERIDFILGFGTSPRTDAAGFADIKEFGIGTA